MSFPGFKVYLQNSYLYQAPPANVNIMPNPFVAVILRSKIITAKTMESTCFTLPTNTSHVNTLSYTHATKSSINSPATVMVKADVFLLAVKLTTFKKKAITPFNKRAKKAVVVRFV